MLLAGVVASMVMEKKNKRLNGNPQPISQSPDDKQADNVEKKPAQQVSHIL